MNASVGFCEMSKPYYYTGVKYTRENLLPLALTATILVQGALGYVSGNHNLLDVSTDEWFLRGTLQICALVLTSLVAISFELLCHDDGEVPQGDTILQGRVKQLTP